jgi:type II secretory pathway pseudopilin PulG
MIVISLLLILISIAVPVYNQAILRAKEPVLRQNLFTMRQVIDQYTLDKQKAPQSLGDLVSAGYLRRRTNPLGKTVKPDPLRDQCRVPGLDALFDCYLQLSFCKLGGKYRRRNNPLCPSSFAASEFDCGEKSRSGRKCNQL